MIIDHFNLFGMSVTPKKADTPLTVDSYTPLIRPIATEPFQPIAGNGRQIAQAFRKINLLHLRQRAGLKSPIQSTYILSDKDRSRSFILEALDHSARPA